MAPLVWVPAVLDVAAALALGLLCWAGGKAAQKCRLPLITGYLLAGMALGPGALAMLQQGPLERLALLEHIALGVIALAAGAELRLSHLHRTGHQVACMTAAIAAASWIAVCSAVLLLAPRMPLTRGLPAAQVRAVASLAGSVAMARSPASAIAVLKETEGKGSFCSLVMAVVVVKDVLLFCCFAVNLEIATTVTRLAGAGWAAGQLMEPMLALLLSLVLGLAGGACLGLALQLRGSSALLARLPPKSVARCRALAIIMTSSTLFFGAKALHAEPLLACVMAGLVAANRKVVAAANEGTDDAASLALLMPLTNLAFFGLVGASVKLHALVSGLGLASVLFLVRLGGVAAGSWAGCRLSCAPPEQRQHFWKGMVTQAGVAMGLAKSVAVRFPTWGPDFASVMYGMIIMNMMIGPPLFKSAIVAVGEAHLGGKDAPDEEAGSQAAGS